MTLAMAMDVTIARRVSVGEADCERSNLEPWTLFADYSSSSHYEALSFDVGTFLLVVEAGDIKRSTKYQRSTQEKKQQRGMAVEKPNPGHKREATVTSMSQCSGCNQRVHGYVVSH